MTNFFTPQQKLITKTRQSAKVINKHDVAKTPCQRLLARHDIDQAVNDTLTRWYTQLNPAQLRRDITALQDRLFAISAATGHPHRVAALHPSRAPTREAPTPPFPGILT
jgi:hypothetical protein